MPYLEGHLSGLVLWNPVLDLAGTFLKPALPWGLANFSGQARRQLHDQGYLVVDESFRLGRVLFEELGRYDPDPIVRASNQPALVIHGDQDSCVSYEVARDAATARSNCQFHRIAGSDHGFDSRDREDEAIAVTIGWLVALARSKADRRSRSGRPPESQS